MLRIPVAVIPNDIVIETDLTPIDSIERIKYIVQADLQIPLEKQTVMIGDEALTETNFYELAKNSTDGITVYVNLDVIIEVMNNLYIISVPIGRNTKITSWLQLISSVTRE